MKIIHLVSILFMIFFHMDFFGHLYNLFCITYFTRVFITRVCKSICKGHIFSVTNITCVTTSWVIVTDWSYSIDLARPKSHIFKRQFEFTKRFPGFRSLYWCFKFFKNLTKIFFKIIRFSVKKF